MEKNDFSNLMFSVDQLIRFCKIPVWIIPITKLTKNSFIKYPQYVFVEQDKKDENQNRICIIDEQGQKGSLLLSEYGKQWIALLFDPMQTKFTEDVVNLIGLIRKEGKKVPDICHKIKVPVFAVSEDEGCPFFDEDCPTTCSLFPVGIGF